VNSFLLDTNIPSELTRSHPDPQVVQWVRTVSSDHLYLSVLTLGEIRKGIRMLQESTRRAQLEQWFEFELRSWFAGRTLPVTDVIAERWGVLDGERQLQGLPLNTADGLIAATALEHGLTVVTCNVKDFTGLGVSLFNPWEVR